MISFHWWFCCIVICVYSFSSNYSMNLQTEENIDIIESNIGVHTFNTTVGDRLVKIEVLKFKDSIFVWIGEKRNGTFSDLSLALLSQRSSEPVSTKIMGQPTDLTSINIATKLTKKLGKLVYVSFNLTDDRLTVPVVNKRIAEEIQKHPEFF